jgi:hypothetical protein
MTIIRPSRGETFDADLTVAERGVLWVTTLGARRVHRYTLRAVFAVGWRIIAVNEAERALLEEHGFEVRG